MLLLGVCVLSVSWLFVGCVSWKAQAERYLTLEPTRYVIVHPVGREDQPAVRAFIERKRARGFDIELVGLDLTLEPAARFAAIAEALAARNEPEQSAYLLILASHAELPMGPWPVTGAPEGVLSDLPLLAGVTELGRSVDDGDWRGAFAFPPPWIAGRVPFEGEHHIAAMLENSVAMEDREHAPTALLGTERFAVPFDAALVMAGVDAHLEERGWKATSYANDAPRDEALDRIELTRTGQNLAGHEVQLPPLHPTFLVDWARSAPDLVFLISHASGMPAKFTSEDGGEMVYFVGAGRGLINPETFLLYNDGGLHDALDAPASPVRPAFLMTTGCSMGDPENLMLADLVVRGWVGPIWTSTHTNGPAPPIAAMRAERSAVRYVAAGLPIGMAHHATITAYLSDATRDPFGWLVAPFLWGQREVNVLSYTIYGDPSVAIVERDGDF